MEELTVLKSHYLTGILVLLSLTAGSAVASAATKTMPDSSTAQTAQVVQAAAHHYGPHRPFYHHGFVKEKSQTPRQTQRKTRNNDECRGCDPMTTFPEFVTLADITSTRRHGTRL
jgi:hypothetical protein